MTGLIILAAGSSTRLGKPKQNLLYNGKTLLQNAIATGLVAECRPIIVVLGANSAQIEKWPHHPDISYLQNDKWEQGMASSIVLAVKELEKYNTVYRVVIMVCDQPFVTPALIDELVLKQQDTGKVIIASAYGDANGIPALFDKTMFSKLLQLSGKEGARKLIANHPLDLATVHFAQGAVDIDTADDYDRLMGSGN